MPIHLVTPSNVLKKCVGISHLENFVSSAILKEIPQIMQQLKVVSTIPNTSFQYS